MPNRFTGKRILIMGLGYIGLPTAAAFASRRMDVVGVDVKPSVVETINQGRIHIVEPELDMIVQSAVASGYLKASLTPEISDVYLIAVPTPFRDGHQPDLSYIESAAMTIAPLLKTGDLVVLESTSPVGATDQLAQWLATARPDLSFPQDKGEDSDIRVAHCPERVLPGKVVRELVENDRIVGGMTRKCGELAQALYKIFVSGNCVLTDARTAEMCKLTENAFRDVNIAFANELSLICDRIGVSVWELIRLANLHPRVKILQPGPGVGGHCIAVDPWFIVSSAPDVSGLIRTAREVNDGKPKWVVDKVKEAIAKRKQMLPEKPSERVVVACFGLAFKADIDDFRESPAIKIVIDLFNLIPGQVVAVEPNYEGTTFRIKEQNIPLVSMDYACEHADVLVMLVDHEAFRNIRPVFKNNQLLVDTKGIWTF